MEKAEDTCCFQLKMQQNRLVLTGVAISLNIKQLLYLLYRAAIVLIQNLSRRPP